MTPRVLVTGFGAFPGAPVNPTEGLIAALDADAARFADICRLETRVFDVDYRGLPGRLDEIGAAGCPDIAIHFGLAASAHGFRLERTARNEIRPDSVDIHGFRPDGETICDHAESISTSLPIAPIADALGAADLPVEVSDDAGGYLCNFLFYHARAGLCDLYRPPMAGFVHVPPAPGLMAPHGMDAETLLRGASIIIRVCVDRWVAEQQA
ncbi:MAG: hypothetical protein KF723_00335 [Rhizobiaceae bacterium]|nr:hypothetical protein [Rhizobiaceae bacterium]